MPDEQINQNAEIHGHEPDAVASRVPDHGRATLPGVLVLLGLLGVAAAAGHAATDSSVSPRADECSITAAAPSSSIQDQFKDTFTPGVIGDAPIGTFVKIGGC